jgi:outer membrane protein assembly factor BamA
MNCSSPMRVVVLGGLYALLFGQVIRAQSPEHKPKACVPSPCPSSDTFEDMTGKKVKPKMIVDDVKFDGPAHLPDSSEEQEAISELKQHMFNVGPEGLEEVLEVRIRGDWQKHGFFKVIATGQAQVVSADSTDEHVLVTIHVEPGLQYRLGDVRFREADPDEPDMLAFPREELRKLIPLQEGDLFSTEKIRESLDAMEKFYGSYGYLNFVETPVTEVDDATQRISLLMELDEGKQFRVGKVEVFGLEASKAAMLTSALQAGDVFNRSLVDDFVEANMSALPEGASRNVLGTYSDEKQGTVDIVVDFRARPQQREF